MAEELILKGKLSEDIVKEISREKGEPEWMREMRLQALKLFNRMKDPLWVKGLENLKLEDVVFYSSPRVMARDWDDLPEHIRKVYEKLGLPEQEKRFLAGLTATFDSENVYHKAKELLESMGVIMLPMEEAVQKYPDLVRKYFGRVFPMGEHRYAALHYALWSGGTFVYVPKGVRVPFPLEAFFYIYKEEEWQFEHTLVVADEGSYVHFIEACAAPTMQTISFHDGVVEVYAHRNAHVKFTTVQNWSRDILNFNNKRAIAEEGAFIEWIEGSIGSRESYVYPSVVLKGEGSRTHMNVFTLSRGPYVKDSGAKVFHMAPNTKSTIVSKSISSDGGVSIYRGLIRILKGARNAVSTVSCDSLLLDNESEAHTYPHAQVEEPSAVFTHEATTGKLSDEQLFYLRSRGFDEDEAKVMAVVGFIKDILREMPLEYANALKTVLEADFSRSVG